jgi:predicted nucleotidyltransferase
MIDLFASKSLVRLLSVLLLNAETAFYQQQLVRLTGSGLRPVQMALDKLTAAGLVSTRRDGRQIYYRVVTAHPAFADLRSLFVKTFAVADVLRVALEPLVGIESAFVHGSVAAGEQTALSDVDLFVVGSVSRRSLAAALSPVERTLGRDVNATVYDRTRLAAAVREGNHFVLDVMSKPKLWVMGDPGDLERLARTGSPVQAATESP